MQFDIKKTEYFDKWMHRLKDLKGKITIARRIERMSRGNFGDMKSLGEHLCELRVMVGPGYRVYFTIIEEKVVILLVGGDKSTQSKDIKKAKRLQEELDNERQ